MQHLYFAYGSNLSLERLRQRVGVAAAVAPARLADHELRVDKRGRDGTAKANLRPMPGSLVWGVVYELAPEGLDRLDAFEGGYERLPVAVATADGVRLEATTYRSSLVDPALRPRAGYLRLIVEGARAHGLPAEWIASLEALPCHLGDGP